jgi:quercetin dioxygenase-like cupin family protein
MAFPVFSRQVVDAGVYKSANQDFTRRKMQISERKMIMNKYRIGVVVLVLLAAVMLGLAQGEKDNGKKVQKVTYKVAQPHTMITPNDVKWGPAPPALPAGAQLAVLSGDPSKAGPFTIRVKFPDGYKVSPHWHPTDENVTVLEGTFAMGVGDKLDASNAHDMTVGSFVRMPKGTRHYALAKGETVVQVHAEGPFVINYVNPNDDPRKQTKK